MYKVMRSHKMSEVYIPLNPSPSIMPPLPDITGFGFVKDLLQYHESITPNFKFFDLALFNLKLTTFSCLWVEW